MTVVMTFLGCMLGMFIAEFISRFFGKKISLRVKDLEDEMAASYDGMRPEILIKKLHPDAQLPAYAKPGDAGADLCAVEETEIQPNEWKLIKCGFAMELPDGWEAQVRSRSGLALKNGVMVLNSPGTIDAGYRGEIGAIMMNFGPKYTVKKGERIAQLVVVPVGQGGFTPASELSRSDRGTGGFGHTGVK